MSHPCQGLPDSAEQELKLMCLSSSLLDVGTRMTMKWPVGSGGGKHRAAHAHLSELKTTHGD